MSLFAELKRRNVIRMGGLYLVGAWMIAQVAETVLPVFDVPNWVLRALMIMIALGFVPVMVFAWVFELTPDGIKRDKEVDRSQSIAPRTGQRMNVVIAVLLSIGLAWYVLDKFVISPARDAVNMAASLKTIEAEAEPEPTPSINTRSIAVLPFDNLSADKDNAYFADGIQDEILTSLSRIGQLKVISRTSTKSYSSRPDNLPQIARELGVASILEGSVQKVGNRVRVNVQLIEAASDHHLWAETYDRSLDDVFAVQSEIALKIAQSLRATLTRDERATLAVKPTDNTAAYDAYLRGIALHVHGLAFDGQRKAADAFAEAVRFDPDFALAWARLASVASYLYVNGVDPTISTADYVKHAADEALRLNPQALESQIALGAYRYRVLRDLPAAAQALEAALRQSPNNPDALSMLGFVERRQGKWEQAVKHLEQASELDPRNTGFMVTIGGETLKFMRRYDEALAWLDRTLALTPGATTALTYKAQIYLIQGRLADAEHVLDPLRIAGEDPNVANMRSEVHLFQRNYDAVIAELQPLLAQADAALNGFGPQMALRLGDAQRLAGQDVQARDTYQRLIARIEPNAGKMDDTIQPMMLALAYANLGKDRQALEQAQRAVALYSGDAVYRPHAEIVLSRVQAITGDHEAAIAGLTHLLQVPGGITPAMLQIDPAWDPLRKDPAFKALLKQDADGKTGATE